jgi:RsiW-degrading membrane proteinase PrsW (M82 family)
MTDKQTGRSDKVSFAGTLKAVLWSFFGVRKRSDYERDAEKLNPVYVLVAMILAAAVFVGVLLLVVQMAVKQ